MLAGLLFVLHQLHIRPHVYCGGGLKTHEARRLDAWLGPASPEPTHWHVLTRDGGRMTNTAGKPVPLVFCVTPELVQGKVGAEWGEWASCGRLHAPPVFMRHENRTGVVGAGCAAMRVSPASLPYPCSPGPRNRNRNSDALGEP